MQWDNADVVADEVLQGAPVCLAVCRQSYVQWQLNRTMSWHDSKSGEQAEAKDQEERYPCAKEEGQAQEGE